MPDILIRGLDTQAVRRLKNRAQRHGRSLQSEARLLLEHAAGAGPKDIAAMLEGWRKQFSARRFSASANLLRQDRSR